MYTQALRPLARARCRLLSASGLRTPAGRRSSSGTEPPRLPPPVVAAVLPPVAGSTAPTAGCNRAENRKKGGGFEKWRELGRRRFFIEQ